jgi:hypothetical protein
MPRTFSLQRLMLAITLFCIACSIAAAYPEPSLACLILLSLFTPTLIVCQVLVSLSSRSQRMTTLLFALVGAAFGLLLIPAHIDFGCRGYTTTISQAIEPLVLPIMIFPTLGAIFFGSAALLDDILRLRHRP